MRVSGSRTRAISECMRICSRPQCLFCLAKVGAQVIVPFRDEDEKRHLKVMGDLGQIVPLVRPHIESERSRRMLILSGFLGMGHEKRTTNRRVSTTLGYRVQPCRKGLRNQVLEVFFPG